MRHLALRSTLLASLVAITLTAGLVVSGAIATSSTPPSAEPEPAAEPMHSYVWSADAGIDLFARGPELVRAAFEASWVWSWWRDGPFFPGYFDALQYTEADRLDNFSELALEPRYEGDHAPVTDYTHITDFSATDTTVHAAVCTYGVFTADSLHRVARPERVGSWYEVNLELPDGEPGQPGMRDYHPEEHHPDASSTPGWNVFGNWQITRTVYQHPEDVPQGCLDWYQERFPDFSPRPGQNGLFAPEGYEVPVHPVAVQYPEWIGPWRPQ